MQSGKVFSQVKKNFLEQLPIPSSFDPSQKELIAGLVEKLIITKNNNDKAKLLAQLEDDVAKGFVKNEVVLPQSTLRDTDSEEGQ